MQDEGENGSVGKEMELLIGNVHKLSVSTLCSMATVIKANSVQDEEVVDEAELETWQRQMSSAAENWPCANAKLFAGSRQAIVDVCRREFGQGSKVTKAVIELEAAKSWESASPCLILGVSGGHRALDKIWELLSFDCWIGGRRVGALGEKIPLDEPWPKEAEIRLWKGVENSSEKRLLAKAAVPINGEGTLRADLTEVRSSKYGHAHIDVRAEIVNGNKSSHRGPMSMLNEVVSGCLVGGLHGASGLVNGLVESTADCEVEYLVRVKKVRQSDSVAVHIRDADGKRWDINEEVIEIPIGDFFSDTVSLVVEKLESANLISSSSKRESFLWPLTPTKKEKRRSSEVLLDTLAFAAEGKASDRERTDSDEHTVSVASIPWSDKVSISQKSLVHWELSVVGMFTKEGKISPFNSAFHYHRLFQCALKRMSESELLAWNGELSDPLLAMMEALLRSFCNAEERDYALIELHERYCFNHEVVFRALCRLINLGRDVYRDRRLRFYAGRSLDMVLATSRELDWLMISKEDGDGREARQTQLHYALQNAAILYQTAEARHEEALMAIMRTRLAAYLASKTAVQMDDYLQVRLMFVLKMIDKCMGEASKWTAMLANAVTEEFRAAIPQLQEENTENLETLEALYRSYIFLRTLEKQSTLKRNDELHELFSPFLFSWADLAVTKAKAQVSVVMELTRERHSQLKSTDRDFSPDAAEWAEWLEAASHVNGIFRTCFLTWKSLAWPDRMLNVQFGCRLFVGIHQTFKSFVADFFAVVNADDEFDRRELVIILLNVLRSMKYLRQSALALCDFMSTEADQGEETTSELRSLLSGFSDTFGDAVSEADDSAEELVLTFCQQQRKEVRKFFPDSLVDDDDGDDGGGGLLGYMDSLLQFVNGHIGQSETADSGGQRLTALLNQTMFKVCDEELSAHYEERSAVYARKKDPAVFEQLSFVLQESIGFRRNLGIEPDSALLKLQADLYPRSEPTADLVAEIVRGCAASQRTATETVGQITFKACFVSKVDCVHVQLISISDLRPRSSKDTSCNFSLTLTLLPLSKEPYLARQRTLSYEKTRGVNFAEENGGVDRAEFVFHLPSHAFHPGQAFLQFDLFHQIPYVKHKVYGGGVTICLDELNVVMDDGGESVRYLDAVTMPIAKFRHREDSEEYKELKGRKDQLAKIFLERYDKHRLEKHIFESSGEWARVDDAMVSAHLISRHLMELREHADNNPSLFVAGEVDAQIAYNETRQIVSVRLLRLRNVRPRLDHRQELNVSVGVRVMPTKAAEQRTKTYPNKTDLRFKQSKKLASGAHTKCKEKEEDIFRRGKRRLIHEIKRSRLDNAVSSDDAFMEFKLHRVNFNEHMSFVELSLYDNSRANVLGSRHVGLTERHFLGHVVVPLEDVHPIHSGHLQLASVAPRRYVAHGMPVARDSEALNLLRKRSDDVAKDYVEESDRRADGKPVARGAVIASEWATPEPETTEALVMKHLQRTKLEMENQENQEHFGNLRYSVSRKHDTLAIELVNISGIRPLSQPCNFSVSVEVYPTGADPFCLSAKSLIYPDSTDLLFDLQGGSNAQGHKFAFDLSSAINSDTIVIAFLLFLHTNTSKTLRGAFFATLDSEEVKETHEAAFRALPIPDTKSGTEISELCKRSVDGGKTFADKWTRLAEGRAVVTLFSFREWAKM